MPNARLSIPDEGQLCRMAEAMRELAVLLPRVLEHIQDVEGQLAVLDAWHDHVGQCHACAAPVSAVEEEKTR